MSAFIKRARSRITIAFGETRVDLTDITDDINAGDLLVCVILGNTVFPTDNTGETWTRYTGSNGSGGSAYAYTRTALGTEEWIEVTTTAAGAIGLFVIEGHDPTNPFDVTPNAINRNFTDRIEEVSVTTVTDNALVFAWVSHRDNSYLYHQGGEGLMYIEDHTLNVPPKMVLRAFIQEDAGPTPIATAFTGNVRSNCATFAIRPANPTVRAQPRQKVYFQNFLGPDDDPYIDWTADPYAVLSYRAPQFKDDDPKNSVTFDAAADVDTSTGYITLSSNDMRRYELYQYNANGNPPIGGLVDGDVYGVRLNPTDNSVQLQTNVETLRYVSQTAIPLTSTSTGTHEFKCVGFFRVPSNLLTTASAQQNRLVELPTLYGGMREFNPVDLTGKYVRWYQRRTGSNLNKGFHPAFIALLDTSNRMRSWLIGHVPHNPRSLEDDQLWLVDPSHTVNCQRNDAGFDVTNVNKYVLSHNGVSIFGLWTEQGGIGFGEPINIVGGSLQYPMDVEQVYPRTGVHTTDFQGGTQFQFYEPVTFGDGAEATHIRFNKFYEFVPPAGFDQSHQSIHIEQNGLTYHPSTGDSMTFAAGGAISARSPWKFELISGATSSTWQSAGFALLNVDLILDNIGAATGGMVVADHSEVQRNDCDMSGGWSFNTPRAGVEQHITINNQADASAISNCTFDTGTPVRVTSNVAFTNVTARVENTPTGANVSVVPGGGSVITTGNPGTGVGQVQILAPGSTLTLTGLQNPTEVRVFDASSGLEIAGQEIVSSGTFTASVQVTSANINILSREYLNIYLREVDTSSDTTIPIQQQFDRQYENP